MIELSMAAVSAHKLPSCALDQTDGVIDLGHPRNATSMRLPPDHTLPHGETPATPPPSASWSSNRAYSRSKRSTGRTKTVAPPTSTSSG
jgi:hypothetical protein